MLPTQTDKAGEPQTRDSAKQFAKNHSGTKGYQSPWQTTDPQSADKQEAGERTQHTPGPWYQYNPHSRAQGEQDSQMVCTDSRPRRVFGDKRQLSQPFIVVQTTAYTSADRAEAEANARLIAAAPELLEACKEGLRGMNIRTPRDSEIKQTLRAAIAKAEGK